MRERIASVSYMGATFMVVGDWDDGEPYTEHEPPGFPGLEEYNIFFGTDDHGNDYDLFEILSEKAIESIKELAEEKLKGEE